MNFSQHMALCDRMYAFDTKAELTKDYSRLNLFEAEDLMVTFADLRAAALSCEEEELAAEFWELWKKASRQASVFEMR